MHSYGLIVLGIFLSALAQLGLKRIAAYETWTFPWLVGIGFSIGVYGLAFLIYSYILRHFKVTVAGPLMTVGVVGVVVIGGLLLGETLSVKQWVGVATAAFAVYLLIG
jgi:drug/metabolite transporter (DMT)-like permease